MTGALFIDLTKAFDTIGHSTLINKLNDYGVKEKELKWFTDYLFGRFQFVTYDNESSERHPVTCGVPQGSVLGPILFLIFFDDFDNILKHSNVIKFADDTVIYVSNKNKTNIENQLNEDLERISKYFHDNELIINLKKSKTESLLFGTAKRLATAGYMNLTYRNIPINYTNTYKYLGTLLDNRLALNIEFSRLHKKASNKVKLITKVRKHLTDKATRTVINSYVKRTIMFSFLVNLNLNNT